jgi:hypothetical protein
MTEREKHLKAMTAIRMQGVGAYGEIAKTCGPCGGKK